MEQEKQKQAQVPTQEEEKGRSYEEGGDKMVAIAVMVVLSVFFICLAVSDYAKYKYGNTSENDCEMCPYRKECEETLIKVEPDSFCETKTYKIENIGQGKFFIYSEPKRLTRKECLEMARRMTLDDR